METRVALVPGTREPPRGTPLLRIGDDVPPPVDAIAAAG